MSGGGLHRRLRAKQPPDPRRPKGGTERGVWGSRPTALNDNLSKFHHTQPNLFPLFRVFIYETAVHITREEAITLDEIMTKAVADTLSGNTEAYSLVVRAYTDKLLSAAMYPLRATV